MNDIQFSPARTSYYDDGQEFSSAPYRLFDETSRVLLTPGLAFINGFVRIFVLEFKPGWWDQMSNAFYEVLYRIALTIIGLVTLPFVLLGVLFGYPLYLIAHSNKRDFVYHTAKHSKLDETNKVKSLKALVLNTILMPDFACTANKIPASKFRVQNIAKALVQNNADFIALQETFSSEDSDILDEELYQHGYSTVRNIGPRAFGINSGLFIASKHPLSNIHFYKHPRLKANIDSFANKGFIIATAKVGSRTIVIANTHLNAGGTDDLPGYICRAIQVIGIYKRIDQYVKEMFAKGQVIDGVLLFGDMNMGPFYYASERDQEGLLPPTLDSEWTFASRLYPILNKLSIPNHNSRENWNAFVTKIKELKAEDEKAYAKLENELGHKGVIEKFDKENAGGPLPTVIYKHDLHGRDVYARSLQGTTIDKDYSQKIFRGNHVVAKPERADHALIRRACTIEGITVEEPDLELDRIAIVDSQGKLMTDHLGLDVTIHFA